MAARKFMLRRVPINSQGYDRSGNYWGVGAPLFEYETPDGDIEELRAGSRESAKAKVLAKYPEYKGKPEKQHVPSSQIGGFFNPSKTSLLKKLRKGIRGYVKLSRGRLIIKT